jgi:hypothetical protein
MRGKWVKLLHDVAENPHRKSRQTLFRRAAVPTIHRHSTFVPRFHKRADMRFEVGLPGGIDVSTLYAAGLDAEEFQELSMAQFTAKKPPSLPATVRCPVRSNKPIVASVTVFSFGEHERIGRYVNKAGKIIVKRGKRPDSATEIRVEISDEKIGRAIRKHLERYSFKNDGEGLVWKEHCALWNKIEKILKRAALSYSELEQGKAMLTRRAIQSLMRLGERIDPTGRHDIHSLFTEHWVPKTERGFVAQWLLKRFEFDPETDDQLGMRIWDNAIPEIANDLIRLIKDRRYDHHRGPLCEALAKTKHPRAADVIASVMDQKWMAFWCLSALGKVRGAERHIPKIRKFLRHSESDVRREAKKLLKKLGQPIDTAPPPVHLVKHRRLLPKGLEEWSRNLDMDDLLPTLQKVSRCVQQGFGRNEIAEVVAVAQEMKPDQTKAFRFPVSADGGKSELWLVIFMDDIDAPDLEVHGSPGIIRKLEKLNLELPK